MFPTLVAWKTIALSIVAMTIDSSHKSPPPTSLVSTSTSTSTSTLHPTTDETTSNHKGQRSRRRQRRRLIWHRRDLRLHDNELYSNLYDNKKGKSSETILEGDDFLNNGDVGDGDDDDDVECISLYIFDSKYFQPQPSVSCPKDYDTIWCGPCAAQAMIEAVHGLRQKLRSIDGKLLVRIGNPISILPRLAQQLEMDEIVFGEEPGTYEQSVGQILQQHYWNNPYDDPGNNSSITIKSVAGYMLYHPDDLPTDPNLWSQLAHPKQQQSSKKKRNQAKAVTMTTATTAAAADGNNRVDVTPERFKGICRIMGDFRKAARSAAKVRSLQQAPTKLILLSTAAIVECGCIPTLEELMAPILYNMESSSSSSSSRRPMMGVDRNTIALVIQQLMLDGDDCCSRNKKGKQHYSSEERGDATTTNSNNRSPRSPRTEEAALERLDSFVSSGRAAIADRSRVDVVTDDHSSRFSVHLALGTLSLRAIYWKVQEQQKKEQEQQQQQQEQEPESQSQSQTKSQQGSQWLASHLGMRDFFLYTAFTNDKYLYSANGIPKSNKRKGKKAVGKRDKDGKQNNGGAPKTTATTNLAKTTVVWKSPSSSSLYKKEWIRWATGTTKFPLIDAAMREFMATGYCSNRVRQNTASFLIKDLHYDWRAGAEWFQFWLEDHCVGANYGNWLYFSGVGPDPKNRHFRSISQMKKYDATPSPGGSYVLRWIPELRCDLSEKNPEVLFRPWDFKLEGFDDPIVDPKSQYTWQDAQYLEENGKLLEDF